MEFKAEPILQIRAKNAEGPVWDDERRRLFWVDIEGHTVNMFDPATGRNDSFSLSERVGCLGLYEGTRFIIGLHSGLGTFSLADGSVSLLFKPEAHLPDNRFNDGKCDPAGRFWAGTMNLKSKKGAGTLYRLNLDGSLDMVLADLTISNGLAWKGNTMYLNDSGEGCLYAFEYNPDTGAIDPASRRTLYQGAESDGVPDGMALDSAGNLWVALWGGGRVICLDSSSGKEMARIQVPASQTSSCAFGGEGSRTLFITSASEGLEPAQEPLAGSLFAVDVGVAGSPSSRYRGTI